MTSQQASTARPGGDVLPRFWPESWHGAWGKTLALSLFALVNGAVTAAVLAGLTSGLMVLLKVPHPPAGATTLIVSLGLIHEPWKYPLLIVGVLLLIVQGFLINRAAGLPYPLWNPVDSETKARYPSFS